LQVAAATPVAVLSVREWLDESAGNAGAFNAIVFCVFNEKDEAVYQRYLPVAFPDDIVASEE
jgi:O-acetyl-ADP-ribose deacetylase (regulator of RNase III)